MNSVRTFYDLSDEYSVVAVTCIRRDSKDDDSAENLDHKKESVRTAIGVGASVLQSHKVQEILIDGTDEPDAAAEGASLKLWYYEELRMEKDRRIVPEIKLFQSNNNQAQNSLWNTGLIKGKAQNIARRLTECPANLMTPTAFAENACELFKHVPFVTVTVRDKNWAKQMRMNSFLSVSKGSSEPPVFLEIKYQGDPSVNTPIVLIGKGITFDTGGSNLKSTTSMADMRGDKGGAACVLAATHAITKLKIPINVTTLIPLCENIIGGNANKPGDIIIAMNGKTVRVDNTDAEGRLILADALHYAKSFNPKLIVDVATLTGAMSVALGAEATGVFTNSNTLWEKLRKAGQKTGDRVWRFPLWKSYRQQLKEHSSVDLTNIGKSSGGGACIAAAFLREFVPPVDWMHLDIAGVMGPNASNAYLSKGMTGKPTRTLIEFLMS